MTFTEWADARMLNPRERAIALRAWRASREAAFLACQKMCKEDLTQTFVPISSQENSKTD